MSELVRKRTQYSRSDTIRALRLTQWAIPALLALIGIAYTLFEHQRHRGDPFWPWPTWLGSAVLGIVGPALSWIVLHWAIRVAHAYLASQEQLMRRAEELTSLNNLSIAASRNLDLGETLSAILEQTIKALDADAGMVFIQEDKEPGLRLEAHRGISGKMAQKEARLRPGHCLCGQAVASRRVLFAADIGDDPRCTSNLCICEGFRSVACAPLEAKGQLVGLLQLASPDVEHFTKDQTDFLATAAAQVSMSIENARLYDKVRSFNIELEQKVIQRTSELETARQALAEKARQLQRLLGESFRVQEDTQSRIAHDMHDGVTQIVIGALYEIQAARQALLDEPDRASESLSRAQLLLAEVELEIRRVIYDLHPPVLDMMGLVVALKRFTNTYTETFGIDCDLQVKGQSRRLSKETEIAIYRIIQAAIQNVANHSKASRALVQFDFDSTALQVVVLDNGIGFDRKVALETPGDHLGLIGMKERAEAIGARLVVASNPNKGTKIQLHLPSPEYLNMPG